MFPDIARIQAFRNFRTGTPPNDSVVYIDGRPVVSIAPGSVFEGDVPPRRHVVTTDPEHPEYAEVAPVSLTPGSTVYLTVDDNWVNDDTKGTRTPIFSIAPINPFIARLHAGRLPLQSAREGQEVP